MTYPEFQNLARLYVVGALEEKEVELFEKGRVGFGYVADLYVAECRRLEAAFALSLDPVPARRGARQQLLARIGERRGSAAPRHDRRTRMGKDRPFHGATGADLQD